ncbi:uncharacterized protein LOC121359322 [Pyrgilauda ruficollis]|uniref:uncharacterized protein LOC121359322 n=1 Tax=Pyrgilauda ruficollis TaxID=221976 RepID=UPI001B874EF5|nr:uncharacterized protein LOC121359322 [Pyrgilauda ruficollis]
MTPGGAAGARGRHRGHRGHRGHWERHRGWHWGDTRAFSAAARRLHPSLLFFATFDPEAARALGLRPGRVLLFEPFLERPRRFRGDPRDTPQMEAFLQRGRRATLRKLKAQSMAGSWEDALDGTPIVAFAKGDDPDGFEFLETLKEVAQARRDRPGFGVLWIDPGDFPGLVPSWEDTFDIDLSRPQLGVVNGTDHVSVTSVSPQITPDHPSVTPVVNRTDHMSVTQCHPCVTPITVNGTDYMSVTPMSPQCHPHGQWHQPRECHLSVIPMSPQCHPNVTSVSPPWSMAPTTRVSPTTCHSSVPKCHPNVTPMVNTTDHRSVTPPPPPGPPQRGQ